MADETEVENVLVCLIAAALYPNGTGGACAAGVPCKTFRGWPTTQAQEAAKKNGSVNISVATRNGVERNTSRYPMEWQTSVAPVHTLTVSVVNNVITLGGTVAVPQNVIVLVGPANVFNYAVQANDTVTSIATALAAVIAASFPGTTNVGGVITVRSGQAVAARIAAAGTLIQEVKRQEKSFQITVWAPPFPDAAQDADSWRNAVVKVIDPMLAGLIRILMPDNTWAHIHYERSISSDIAQNEGLYRRDLFYWVEYATTQLQTGYEIGAFQQQVQAQTPPSGTLPVPSSAPIVNANS